MATRIGVVAALLVAASCSFLQDTVTKPSPEPPVGKRDGYLAQSPDPSELGRDERLLLAEYSDTHAAKLALETQLAETRATIDSLRAQLAQTEEVRDKERTGRAAADAELTRLRATLQERETKILSLHIEKSKLTQDVLLARIEAAERQADAAGHATAELEGPAPGPGGLAMTRAALLVLAAIALVPACSMPGPPRQKPVNAYFSDTRDVERVRRIMFLPLVAAPSVNAPLESLRSAVLAELAKIQRFEIVPLPDNTEEDEAIYAAALQGEQSLDALVSLGRRYRVDGVVLGTITSYRAYPPTHLGLRLQMLSLHSGRSVWIAEGHYDAAEAATLGDVQHFARSYLAKEASMHGWEINLISPTRFAGFVAHRLVATWRE